MALDNPRTAFENLVTPNNIKSRLDQLEGTQTLPSATVDSVSQISAELGDMVAGRIIAPTTENAEPTDAEFDGTFLAGTAQDVADGTQDAWLAKINAGEVEFSVGVDGIYQSRLTNGYKHVANDGEIYRRGLLGMNTLAGQTAPSFGMTYQDDAAAVNIIVPNGNFATLDLTDWTEAQKGAAEEALGTLSTLFNVNSLAVIGTDLYAGIFSGATTSAVWKWDGVSWAALGALSTAFNVTSLAVIGTDLYAGLASSATTSAVWKWDGVSWAALGALSTSFRVNFISIIGADLYAGLSSGATTSAVWKWDGVSWAALGALSTSFTVSSLAVIGADLYAGLSLGATTSSVWKWDGVSWAALGALSTSFEVTSLSVIGTDLYAGIFSGATTSAVWKWDGVSWAALGALSTAFKVYALAVIGTDLYAGIASGSTTSSVWKLNGATWAALGTLSTAFYAGELAVIGTDLYAGLSLGATTSSVWKCGAAIDWNASAGYAEITTNKNATPKIQNAARFAVSAAEQYSVAARSYATAIGGTATVTMQAQFYTAISGGTLLKTETIGLRTGAVLAWQSSSAVVTAPTGATHAIFSATVSCSAGAVTAGIDDVFVYGVLSNYLGFEPTNAKLISNMQDAQYAVGQIPVGAMTVPRVEEARDKLVATGGAAGNVDVGTHYLVTTFVDAYGETDADLTQSTSIAIATSAKTVALTAVPLGLWGTTSRRIYATIAGATQTDQTAYKLMATIANNTGTTATYNVSDATLAAVTTTIPTINTTGSRPAFPKSVSLWPEEMVTSVVVATTIFSGQYYGQYTAPANVNLANNLDEYNFGVYLAAGTYTLKHLGVSAASFGKCDYYIDGVLQFAGIDWYSSVAVGNTIKTGTITVLTSGYHHLLVKVNGKNASASDYRIPFTKITITPNTAY